MKPTLNDFVKVITEDSRTPLETRLKRAGYSDADVLSICAAPGADREIIRASFHRFILPVLPQIISELASSAASSAPGSADARRTVLSLLSPKGPLADDLVDMGALSDDAFDQHAEQMMARLEKARSLMTSRKSSKSTTDEGASGP